MASISVSLGPEPSPGPDPQITVWAEGGIGPASIEEAVWRAALQLWPDWPEAAPAALKQAAERGAAEAPAGIHTLAQLSAALGRPELVLVSGPLSEAAADLSSRAIEWAAETAGLPVRWVVEPETARLPGVTRLLDAGGHPSPTPTPAPASGGAEHKPKARSGAQGSTPTTGKSGGGPKVVFSPIIGRPHPASPVEQLLAKILLDDPKLAPQLAFNQPIEVPGARRMIVDLLFAAAGLIVEIDGYRFHRGRRAFQRDRHRDYLLMREGWRVLRLTATEVADAPEASVDKIRALLSAPKEPLCKKN